MKKIFKVLLVLVILIIIGIGAYYFLNKGTKKKATEVKVVDKIDGYNYTLSDNATDLYKTNFKELKKVLESKNIDEEKYANLVAKMFVIDFFTLDNKLTNDNIGGVEFIHKQALENFKVKAKDTIYKYLESNIYGDRKQKLPEVSKIEDIKVTNTEVSYKDIKDSKAYKIEISFDYKKDLGYPKKKSLILVHEDKLLSIIEMK